MKNWIDQKDKCITSNDDGSTLLVKLNDTSLGITSDNGETVDISWMRVGNKICATCGNYSPEDVKEWAVVQEIK